ncbi:MAG: family transposase [Betaproteobacteria bacterium]|nr:family transposase [Betaproteobacteria bacterium]
MCRVYGVTRAGYYAWRKRPMSIRAQQDETLGTQIKRIHEESRGTYGSLNRAVHKRRPAAGLIFHSDRGMEYGNSLFKARLAHLGILQSMNRRAR